MDYNKKEIDMVIKTKNFYDRKNNLRAFCEVVGDKVYTKWFVIGQKNEIEDFDEFQKYSHEDLYNRIEDWCEAEGYIHWSY